MDFGFATNLVSCIVAGFGIAWGVWAIAAAVTFMCTFFLGRQSTKNM